MSDRQPNIYCLLSPHPLCILHIASMSLTPPLSLWHLQGVYQFAQDKMTGNINPMPPPPPPAHPPPARAPSLSCMQRVYQFARDKETGKIKTNHVLGAYDAKATAEAATTRDRLATGWQPNPHNLISLSPSVCISYPPFHPLFTPSLSPPL
jgi:hypothetical protein